jgi:hypothetical protein
MCWVSVGPTGREELLETLRAAAADARARRAAAAAAYAGQPMPGPGWYADPWDTMRIRWWDGEEWTGYAASSATAPTGDGTAP